MERPSILDFLVQGRSSAVFLVWNSTLSQLSGHLANAACLNGFSAGTTSSLYRL
jgi:hypothetical protein